MVFKNEPLEYVVLEISRYVPDRIIIAGSTADVAVLPV